MLYIMRAAYECGYYESIRKGILTTVLMDRENELIERVRREFRVPRVRALPGPGSAGPGLYLGPDRGSGPAKSGPRLKDGKLRVGIGDDAAVLQARDEFEWVVTTDAFLENVHFLRKAHPPDSVGYKALARATSDIAAMGATGRYFFLTLGLPRECAGKWLDDFLGGMARAARRFGLVLAGGDTTKYPLVVCSLTVLGEVAKGRAVLRSGAQVGDLICVSGRLGKAELGLRLVQTGLHRRRPWARFAEKHLYPEPRLALGEWLAAQRVATSMIDTSDGLSTDLAHICKASGVGAKVWTEKIPAVRIPLDLRHKNFDPLELALHGGEDYELLFTVPKRLAGKLPRKFGRVPLTVIGEVTRGKRILVVDEHGRSTPLQPQGWDPFRNRVG